MIAVTQAHQALGLTRNPFPPTPDAACYFYTENLSRDFAETLHCIRSRKGFLLLTGEVGLGKSTFVKNLMETLRSDDTAVALVLNTFLQGSALLEAINDDFGLAPAVAHNSFNDPHANMVIQLARLNAFLLACGQTARNCVLIIDDAQNLNAESLELVRLLCNLETTQEKLLQIVLVGQPELHETLSTPALRQLKSRVVKHMQLAGLTLADTARYLEFRLAEASQQGDSEAISITDDAIRAIHAATGGNPRQLNLLMDRGLYGLVARRTRVVTKDLVVAAVADTTISHDVAPPRPLARKGMWVRGGALAAMAALLVPTLAVAGWSMWREVPHAAKASVAPAAPRMLPVQETLPPPPVPVAAPPAPIDSTANSLAECATRLSAAMPSAGQASQLVLQAIRAEAIARYGAALAARGVACLVKPQNNTFLMWHKTPQSEQIRGVWPNGAVKLMQQQLQHAGVLGDANIDGWLGARTRDALRQFQIRYDLAPSGEPDALTTLILESFHGNLTRVADRAP